jgi:hypothetical protein
MLTVLEAAMAERSGSFVGFLIPPTSDSEPVRTPPAGPGVRAGRVASGSVKKPAAGAEETRVEVPAAQPPALRRISEPRARQPEADQPPAEPAPRQVVLQPAPRVNPFQPSGNARTDPEDGSIPLEIDWGDAGPGQPPPLPQVPPAEPSVRPMPARPVPARPVARPSVESHPVSHARAAADSRSTRLPRPPPRTGLPLALRLVMVLVILGIAAWPATCLVDGWLKVEAAREELATIRAALSPSGHFLGVASGRLDPGDRLDYFLRETVDGSPPGYPTRDPWEKRYRVRWASSFKQYLLFSTGPDGEPGLCRDEDSAGDDLCVSLGP